MLVDVVPAEAPSGEEPKTPGEEPAHQATGPNTRRRVQTGEQQSSSPATISCSTEEETEEHCRSCALNTLWRTVLMTLYLAEGYTYFWNYLQLCGAVVLQIFMLLDNLWSNVKQIHTPQ